MLRIETLPEDTQAELNRITSITPKELTEYEIGFLRARGQYLRPEQVAVFSEVLGVTKKVVTKEKVTKVEDDPFAK
jgi:hypothetical protein